MQESSTDLARIPNPRLPYLPAVKDNFGIDKDSWQTLSDVLFPNAQSSHSIVMLLQYCKARNLDPLKRCVHIVPIYNSVQKKMVDTVWVGIGELRTTASRTKQYAGRDETKFGKDITQTWEHDKWEYGKKVGTEKITVTFPEYAQVTVYRIVGGQRVAFHGSPVFWMEAFASTKDGCPNSMWQKRPKGQIDKCAEAMALRAAFPEELGEDYTSDEGDVIYQHGTVPQTFEDVKEIETTAIKDRAGSKPMGFTTPPEVKTEPQSDKGRGADYVIVDDPAPEFDPEPDDYKPSQDGTPDFMRGYQKD